MNLDHRSSQSLSQAKSLQRVQLYIRSFSNNYTIYYRDESALDIKKGRGNVNIILKNAVVFLFRTLKADFNNLVEV